MNIASVLRTTVSTALLSVTLTVPHALAVSGEESVVPVDFEFEWERPLAIGFDALIIRPISVVRVVAGAITFVPMGLFALMGGQQNFDNAFESLIGEPMTFAFERPIGELD